MTAQDDIRYAPYANLYPAFTKGGKRCLRIGSRPGQRRRHSKVLGGVGKSIPWPEHGITLVPPSVHEWEAATVYLVSLSEEFHKRWHKQPKNFYVVALHDGAVKSYLEKRFGKLPRRYSGMARYALDLAMMRTSTRNVQGEFITDKARKVSAANVRVIGGFGSVSIRIEDNLTYAAAALKTGRAGVRLAIKKAANSVAGMLNKVAAAKLDKPIETPFKEIVAR